MPQRSKRRSSATLSSNHIYTRDLLIMACAVLLFSVSFGYLVDPASVDWRMVSVASILSGGAGLVTNAINARRMVRDNELEAKSGWSRGALMQAAFVAKTYKGIVDRDLEASEFTPPGSDIERVNGQRAAARKWFAVVTEKLERAFEARTSMETPIEAIEPWPQDIDDEYTLFLKDELVELIKSHQRQVQFSSLAGKRTSFESFATFAAPYAILLSLGGALTRALWG